MSQLTVKRLDFSSPLILSKAIDCLHDAMSKEIPSGKKHGINYRYPISGMSLNIWKSRTDSWIVEIEENEPTEDVV